MTRTPVRGTIYEMIWPILAVIFVLSMLLIVSLAAGLTLKIDFWNRNKTKILFFYIAWFIPYVLFILFFTGPSDLSVYPPQSESPYRLPWKAGVGRLVAQGNRSFTSHRELHEFAWDFVMPIGTPVLAARDGIVKEATDSDDGIGVKPNNFVIIEHQDGQRSGYFHLSKGKVLVKEGDFVKRGQPIALSGMVGQTWFPHLHFLVFNKDKTASLPISFADVPGGVPLAGHLYTSQNGSL